MYVIVQHLKGDGLLHYSNEMVDLTPGPIDCLYLLDIVPQTFNQFCVTNHMFNVYFLTFIL